MNSEELRQLVIDAIRRSAARNPHCSVIPGPVVAGMYADAAIDTIKACTQNLEPWHGKAKGNS